MKSISISVAWTRSLLVLSGVFVVAVTASHAAETDLANVPLANATTTAIHPNIAFVLDDSGSMDYENMPDDGDVNANKYCYKWYKYNTLAYNPAQTYKPPIKVDGTRYPDAVFTAAIMDGYFPLNAKQFDGSTNNGVVDLTTLGTYSLTAATIQFDNLNNSTKYYVSSLKVKLKNGTTIELLDSPAVPSTSGTNNIDTLGQAVQDSINNRSAVTGFKASYDSSSNTLEIDAPASQAGLTTQPTITRVRVSGNTKNADVNSFSTTSYSGFFYATHKTDPNSTICAANTSYNVVTSPSGIAAPGVANGSAAALTNYANWYSYYRKRSFLAKAGVAEAFARLDQDKYRIGLFFINSIESGNSAQAKNHDLMIDMFSGNTADTQRGIWLDRLYTARSSGSTPLRVTLARMGRMYGGKISGWDPVQYSCQRNYTILSTDGFWNESSTPRRLDGATAIGDQDGAAGVAPPEKDSSKAQNTLADVAYYYYHTDLRPGACSSPDVCTDNVPPAGTDPKVDDMAQHQHMTTFTVGFGVNGTLKYQDGYKTAISGDYFDVKQGTKNWPNPTDGRNDETDKIDDLWHAAVNGHGLYFSAKDPDTLSNGLTTALNAIESISGSGAAAATSNLQPVAGDNSIYIATYRTLLWDGELSAYTVSLSTGDISTTPTWQASALLKSRIAATGDGDSRTIYTADGNARILFSPGTGGLTAAQLAYFDNTKLSQYANWNDSQKSIATPALLVNYLRGQDRYEDQDRDDAYGAYERLYRDRDKILGDIIHAQPIYVKAPPYNFTDDGYLDYKTSNANRAATVYVAANDGMVHAFNADTGDERWAYVPPLVLPDMWRLAGKSYGYGENHHFFLDGPLTMADAKIGTSWKTVLIGAMGKGGRGYYALDITNPSDPKPLWTFSADNDPNLGYSYGMPVVTKLSNGKWVAVVTSGYNNIPEGGKYASADGVGRLFVLDIADGSVIKTIPTTAGSPSAPSGLARINIQVQDFSTNNTALAAYGGDLLGNLWRFDLNAGTATKLAALGANKPIMAAPEVGDIDGRKVIFFGTGQYLGNSDLGDTRTQSIYAIKDDGSTIVTDTSKLIKQTLATSDAARTITKNEVNWSSSNVMGWYIDLPDSGERIALDPQLYAGTLVVASTVPTASECQPGGYSWLYQLDYRTGGYVGTSNTTVVAERSTSPDVGLTVSKLPTGTPVIYPITADGKKATPIELRTDPPTAIGAARRVMWRELFD